MIDAGLIPEHRRDAVGEALRAVFGADAVTGFTPIKGGASGALVLRIEARGRPFVLRLEPERIPLADRARGYACMRAAADVSAAPALPYADAAAGVAVMDFIATRPLSAISGGAPGLVTALGELLAQVRTAEPFPVLPPYPEVTGWLLQGAAASGLLAAEALAPHAEALDRILARLPWPAETHVPTHNDPNPRNLLFDGERLWLVDWELAAMNDPLVDVAIGATEYAETPELEDLLMRTIFGRAPDAALRARLAIVRLLTRLFYGGIVLDSLKGRLAADADRSLDGDTPQGFRDAVAAGRLGSGSPETAFAFARMQLRAFLEGVQAPDFETTLALAAEA